ncbi:MAG: leucine--tRNA ligase [Clostridia bacterium]|nr:leucine--tRNA ligase [Clostridia bacterium]
MYNFTEIEKKWQSYWKENNTFKVDVWDFSKPKYYALDMFPYPSGVGLHAGHPEGYTATDIISRMKRMQGYNVLHPMGYDSFGLPAEQYAIQTGNHPAEFTQKNIETFQGQLERLGFSYDWDRVISTSDPSYYKWTQWIFKKLYEAGLAKQIDMPVNWCEELGTVLANDEVINGKSERGGYPVVRKNMKQWIIDIPAYAEKLLNGLDELDWPESTKEMQRNWIGKSEGVEVNFKIKDGGEFSIFTTCIETIYGITFMVLAPEHELVDKLKDRIKNWDEVVKYREETAKKSDFDRTELNKTKSGVKLEGIFAINPINGKEVPIVLGDFVLASYGTGAVMAVPSHDQRDFEYAQKYNLPMVQVIDGRDTSECAFEKQDYLNKNCKLINSEEFTGLIVEEAKKAITDKLVEMGCGKRTTNYHIREWIFARQRFWGEPIPIVHLENGKDVVANDDELPIILPMMDDYKGKNGKAPLENAVEWKNVEVDEIKGIRETSTMPGSAGSSWYFLRYLDPKNDKMFADPKLIEHWMPVDLYIGGPEHAVGHLLYSRMWNNFLFDQGLVSVKEPFKKLVHQGMILGSNGIKMGKRFPKYVVNPDDIERQYGADTLRMYEMFMGPLEADKPWNDEAVRGIKKFLDRVWRLYHEEKREFKENSNLDKIYNQTVKKVTDDYETLNFNTAISQMMIFVNAVYKEDSWNLEYAENFIKLMNPIVPHITEEIWSEVFNHKQTIAYEPWPTYDKSKLENDTYEMVVQVNGVLRGKVQIPVSYTEEEMKKVAKEIEVVKTKIEGKTIIKEIVVPKKLVNIVVK